MRQPSQETIRRDDVAFLAAPGIAARCAREVDWACTPIGPVDTWPQSLRTTVGIVLRSRHPMFLWWGPELVQFYNDAYLPSLGIGKHPRAMGQRGRDCWPEIWPIIGPQIEDVMIRGQSTWTEEQLIPIFRNGNLEDVYWTYDYSPVLDENGRVGGTLVVCTETTVRVVAEQRLQGAHVFAARTAHATSPDALMRVAATTITESHRDVPFALTFVVDGDDLRLVGSSGLTEDEFAVVVPSVRAQLHGAGQDMGLLGLPKLARVDLAAKAFFSAIIAPRGDRAFGFVVFGLTPSLPFDEKYRAHLLSLAEVLGVASSEGLQCQAVMTAQQQLAITNRLASVGALAAGVAHEINNPLATLIANLDMTLDELRAGDVASLNLREIEDWLIDARAGAQRVRKTVHGLKTFSRAGEEQRSPIQILPVLELSIDMTLAEIRKHARLVKVYGAIPLVDADASRLGHVFTNILLNAAQALPQSNGDGNEILITTSADAAGRAIIEFQDTGSGIPANVIERVFDPFFTTKAIGAGTGLGLSICHNIVISMGGTVTVESVEGRGTTFRVALPPASLTPQLSGSAVIAHRSGEASRRGALLIVDDERAVAVALSRLLRAHDVTVLTSAKEAFALIASGREFDVILSDLMMPGMSGMELHEALTAQFPIAGTRMVFVTGGACTEEAEAFLDRVPNERIAKPFDGAHVKAVVQRLVDSGLTSAHA